MSQNILDLARTRALAVSLAPAAQPLDRAAADAAIRLAMRIHGGSRGCTAALAQQYGDRPELAAPRVRWARQRIAALYPAGTAQAADSPTATTAASLTVFPAGCRAVRRATDGSRSGRVAARHTALPTWGNHSPGRHAAA
jgi:hypothetical protein